jgi:hypothetical protein
VATLHRSDGLLDPTYDHPLTRNAVNDFVARPVTYVVCPMCGVNFKLVKKAAGEPDTRCPNDSFNLSNLERSVEAVPESFTNPKTGQSLAALDVKCRGTSTLSTAHGDIPVFWDESRFVDTGGNDFTLWGKPEKGAPIAINVIGRATWRARAPMLDGVRIWEFHAVKRGASPPYAEAIPSNETNPLRSVLQWITVHHTADPALSSLETVAQLQKKHQDEGVEDSPAADIGYHFLIDADGEIYEGRPLGIKGSHVENFNGGNVGIALAGDFESRAQNRFSPDSPSVEALASLDLLVDVLGLRFEIRSAWSHDERKKQSVGSGKECPGDNLIGHVNGPLRNRYPGPPP